ncbi:hypothetical protein BDV18DRAFT_165297 [Aspergillus unguis]
MNPNSYTARASRKSHTKSRLGCFNCKRRKIKCDELKPSCTNCQRHCIECDYVQPDTHNTPSAQNQGQDARQMTFISSSQDTFQPPKRAHRTAAKSPTELVKKPFQFSAADLVLFHHFMSCPELGSELTEWQAQMTRWGFQHHYLLRLLLALAAFHLVRTKDGHLLDIDYTVEAERNYGLALQEAASTMPQINSANGQILYTGAIFIFICSLARGPQAGEYLAFRDDGDPGCLVLFLGVRSILEMCSGAFSLDLSSSHATSPYISSGSPASGTEDHLNRLYLLIENTYPQASAYSDYSNVLGRLRETYTTVRSSNGDNFPRIFYWLYTLPDTFIADLQNRQPLALVLFAFFAVLLKEVDSTWFIRGWPEHIISGIYTQLDEYHRQFITWAVEQPS